MNSLYSEGLGARRQSGVDGDNGAAGIGRTFGGKKRDGGANFFGAGAAPNGSGLNRSFQLSALPVRSSAFFFIRPTSRSVATDPD